MADSTSAQHETIISRAAAEQARAIFYKIETLVYAAVRTEVDHEIEAAINAHFPITQQIIHRIEMMIMMISARIALNLRLFAILSHTMSLR